MTFKLRPYQSETIANILDSMRHGNKRIIVQQPPRTGKTVIMADIARRTTDKGNRVMFLIHRKEVLDQAIATFKANGVDMSLATMGMVQTLTRRVKTLPEPQLIFIDEAHHAIAKSYQRILKAFPNAYVLLFTATPVRTGHDQLDKITDAIIPGKSIKWLTEQGYLAPFQYFSMPNIDTTKLKKSSTGDYTNESMDEAIDKAVYGDVIEQYSLHAKGMQAVCYSYSISSAKLIADRFNEAGISAVEVDGMTPAEERDELVRQFRDQKIKILVNVNLFTEGVDLPNVDCVIMVRPTQSLALYLQFAMRCLNPRPGKKAVIIDHVENWKRFGTPSADRDWEQAIITRKKRKRTDQITTVQCNQCMRIWEPEQLKNGRCPECGFPIRQKNSDDDQDRERKPVHLVKVNLIEIDQETENARYEADHRVAMAKQIIGNRLMQAVADKTVGQLSSVEELKAYGKLHGFKPGWAWYQAKNRGWA